MDLPHIIEYGLESGADFVEVRKEHISGCKIHHHLDGTTDVTHGSETGVGIRIAVDGSWSFVSSNQCNDSTLKDLVKSGIKTAENLATTFYVPKKIYVDSTAYPEKIPAQSLSIEEKIDVIKSLQDTIKDVDDKIIGADLILEEYLSQKQIFSSAGTQLQLIIPRIYFNPRILAHDDKTVSYRRNLGGIGGYEFFNSIEETLTDFAQRALLQLSAKKSPQGKFTVVMDYPLTGVLAHEVLGHSLEGDAVCEKTTVMHDRHHQGVGPEMLTLIDDPTLESGWGSFHYDDEGIPAKRKVLIKNGVINEFITNSEMAFRLNVPCTGGSRAQSYMYPPLIRMSDIFIEPCDQSLEELLEDIDYGVYLRNIVGGHSDPVRGLYNFEICESYLVERGKITDPLSKSTVSGDVMSTLSSIEGIGRDFELNAGFCYKGGQSIAAGIGGPHVKVNKLKIGGAV
jgi:TldD protein